MPLFGLELRFAQRPFNGGREPREIALEYIVGGAATKRIDGALLTDGSGDIDKGSVGGVNQSEIQRAKTAEVGQGKIREYEIGLAQVKCRDEVRFRLYPLDHAIEARLDQMPFEQLGIGHAVLDHHQPQFGLHRKLIGREVRIMRASSSVARIG